MNFILLGLPGTGKTEAGKHLAAYLKWQHIDTDYCVEKYYEATSGTLLTCREIHKKYGIKVFRELETTVINTLVDVKNNVISLGGGTVTIPENIKALKTLGNFIYLKNDRRVIFERLMTKGMPSYLDPLKPYESFSKIADEREPIYLACADIQIDTGSLSPAEIASKILEH